MSNGGELSLESGCNCGATMRAGTRFRTNLTAWICLIQQDFEPLITLQAALRCRLGEEESIPLLWVDSRLLK